MRSFAPCWGHKMPAEKLTLQQVWREAVKHLPAGGLIALEKALQGNDKTLIQHRVVLPMPLRQYADWPVTHAEPLAWCLWQGMEENHGTSIRVHACYEYIFKRVEKV